MHSTAIFTGASCNGCLVEEKNGEWILLNESGKHFKKTLKPFVALTIYNGFYFL